MLDVALTTDPTQWPALLDETCGGDPALRDVPTLGFVSHVHDDVIARARAAGVDQVLARSAFVDRLRAILDPPSSTSTTQ